MSLTTLPILPLEAIISYLDFSSIVSLANSHPSLSHLQPKEQIVIGEDFYISGQGGCMPMPHCPEPYFDVKVETKGLLSIKMTWEWTYLIFVIFFTRAKFLENKIYTEKRQFFTLNL